MKQFLSDLFLKKWQYKLFAVLAAFIVWFYVVKEQNLSVSFSAPLELSNFPSDMRLENRIRTSVDILLEGRRDVINKINRRKVRVIIDIRNAGEGMNTYLVTASRISGLPRGVYVKDVSPARFILEFSKIEEEKSSGSNAGEEDASSDGENNG
ncbi:MAG: CdaR family protein [Candidatus Goldiibacteriota bacterium]